MHYTGEAKYAFVNEVDDSGARQELPAMQRVVEADSRELGWSAK